MCPRRRWDFSYGCVCAGAAADKNLACQLPAYYTAAAVTSVTAGYTVFTKLTGHQGCA